MPNYKADPPGFAFAAPPRKLASIPPEFELTEPPIKAMIFAL